MELQLTEVSFQSQHGVIASPLTSNEMAANKSDEIIEKHHISSNHENFHRKDLLISQTLTSRSKSLLKPNGKPI